ncbi:MAG TPA: NAD(P)-binding domain-containing protein [Ktedonobacteraceae bacterium]|nr:NAD(P)-binding domain-containing protein [Ktedonobacteraceae bacterium]
MQANKKTIAVLGAGNIGATLGKKWSNSGHRVVFGVNDPNGPKSQDLRKALGNQVEIGTVAEALKAGPEVVVMAVPGAAIDALLTEHKAQLDRLIIIDAANRMGQSVMNSFESFKEHIPEARIFRAFNTLGWENFADPIYQGVVADLFYCGSDGEARTIVESLISDIGLMPVYVGGIEQVGVVDSIAGLWFALAFGQKRGRQLAFKLLTR